MRFFVRFSQPRLRSKTLVGSVGAAHFAARLPMPMDRAKMARLRDVVKVLAQLRTESKLKNLPVLPKQPTEVTAEKLMKALHRRLDDGAAKATLVEAWEKFTAPAGDAAGLAGPKAFRLQAAAALATWNGESYTVDDWDDFVTWTLAFGTTYKVRPRVDLARRWRA